MSSGGTGVRGRDGGAECIPQLLPWRGRCNVYSGGTGVSDRDGGTGVSDRDGGAEDIVVLYYEDRNVCKVGRVVW